MESANKKAGIDSGLDWHWFVLDKMTPVMLYDLLSFREAVFVVEQNCIYHELDGLDKSAQHLVGLHDGTVVACLRVIPSVSGKVRVRIGRVAVSPGWRKLGIAGEMMGLAIHKVAKDYPAADVILDAQSYLQRFYENLGFQVSGEEFLEDGIPHIPMVLCAEHVS